MGCTTTASFVDGLPGDHRGILFSFTPPGAIVRQRPPWRLPLWLLADREFMTSFRRGLPNYRPIVCTHKIQPAAPMNSYKH